MNKIDWNGALVGAAVLIGILGLFYMGYSMQANSNKLCLDAINAKADPTIVAQLCRR
jgi:uncharacterized protein (UPF0333 family)